VRLQNKFQNTFNTYKSWNKIASVVSHCKKC
jgi:hypothetical protein